MLILFILLLIFGNQYLLFNEELFIIIAFFCLCYVVKSNLGNLVQTELEDRKNKIIIGYLEFLKKKLSFFNTRVKNNEVKTIYVYNFALIQENYFIKFLDLVSSLRTQTLLDLNKNLESNFIMYFAGLVAKKRKFL